MNPTFQTESTVPIFVMRYNDDFLEENMRMAIELGCQVN